MDEKMKARYEAMGIKVRSGTQEEADSLPILIHPVMPPEEPKARGIFDEGRRAELRGLSESNHRGIEGKGNADREKTRAEVKKEVGMLDEKMKARLERLGIGQLDYNIGYRGGMLGFRAEDVAAAFGIDENLLRDTLARLSTISAAGSGARFAPALIQKKLPVRKKNCSMSFWLRVKELTRASRMRQG